MTHPSRPVLTPFPISTLILAIALFSFPARAAEPGQAPRCDRNLFGGAKTVSVEFIRVVDGDTMKVRFKTGEYSVRMLSMDTPETKYLGKSQGFWGEKAAERLSELTKGLRKIKLELGGEVCDSYGRILAYVWDGGTDLNGQMIEEGLAVNYCIAPNLERCEEYSDLAQEAMDRKRGIFSGKPAVELPYDWRREVSGRDYDKFVGDIDTHEVYSPGFDAEVSVANRVYFMKKSSIRAPFRFVKRN